MFTIKIDAGINTIKMSLEVVEDGKVEKERRVGRLFLLVGRGRGREGVILRREGGVRGMVEGGSGGGTLRGRGKRSEEGQEGAIERKCNSGDKRMNLGMETGKYQYQRYQGSKRKGRPEKGRE